MPEFDPKTQARIEEIVADCIARPPEERKAATEAACAENPDIAEKIRQLLGTLDRIGLAEEEHRPTRPARLGDYRLLERIGGGGMGEVWLAEQEGLGRKVALKLMRPGLALFSRSRERFQREVEALTRLQHPAICPVYDAGEEEGTPYLAMQYLEGRTLAQQVAELREKKKDARSTDRLSLEEKLAWLEEIARGLHLAHEQGFIHRDVKPGNIMITREGRAVLLDFGLARFVEGGKEGLTLSGDRLGTPTYMAPEQISGERPLDRRTDVYALGITLYECLSLHPPFQAETREALYREILNGETTRLSQRTRGIPRDLEVVVATAMDPDPNRRYQDALALAEDLARVRRREPVRARGLNRARRVKRWVRRHRVATVFIAMLVLALGVSLQFQLRLDRALGESRVLNLVAEARGKLPREPEAAAYLAAAALHRAQGDETRCAARSMLHRACTQDYTFRSIPGHQNSIYGIDISKDDRFLVTSSNDFTVKFWDLESPASRPLWSRSTSRPATIVHFCGREEANILVISHAGRLELWDRKGNPLDRFEAEGKATAGFRECALSPDGTLLLAGFHGHARLFTIDEGRLQPRGKELPHRCFVGALALHREKGLLATGNDTHGSPGADAPLRLWRLDEEGATLLRDLPGQKTARLWGVEFSTDGRYLLAGVKEMNGKGCAYLYDLEAEKKEDFFKVLPAGKGKVEARFLDYREGDGWRLVTTSWTDGRITIWNDRGRPMLSPGQMGYSAYHIEINTDRQWFALPCNDGSVRVFSYRGDQVRPVTTFWMSGTNVERVRFRKKGSEIITTSPDGVLGLARCCNTPRLIRTRTVTNVVAQAGGRGKYLLTGSSPDSSAIWNLKGELLHRRKTHSGKDFGYYPAYLSPDGHHFATLFYDQEKRRNHFSVWETGSGALVNHYETDNFYLAPTFLAGSKEILFCERNLPATFCRLILWDYATGDTAPAQGTGENRILAINTKPLVASPDGRRVLCLTSPWLLERTPGGRRWKPRFMTRKKQNAMAGDIAPDGRMALGVGRRSFHLFNEEGEDLGIALAGHTGRITWITFSPDGTLLSSTAKDGTARLWRDDGTLLAVLEAGEGPVQQADFSPDGRYLYTAHDKGTLRRWFVGEEELVEYAEKWYGKVLTEKQKTECDQALAR